MLGVLLEEKFKNDNIALKIQCTDTKQSPA
jgi:hypothetical protein